MHSTRIKQLPNIPDNKIFDEGWNTLTKKLGYSKAVRFVMEFPKQKGDSVKEIRQLRKKWVTIDQLDKEIRKSKICIQNKK